MKKKAKIIISVSIFSLILSFLCFEISHAQYDYIQLESIPGFEDSGSDLKSYIESVYKFGIWTVGIAAVLMITIGGFMYLTSAGNTSKMDVAKKVVTDAIIGLVVALGAYLILYVINPDLIKINISMEQLGTSSGTGVGTTVPSSSGEANSSSVGCGKAVDAAIAKKSNGCTYSQQNRNGCTGNPAYTDCSDLVNTSYLKAGCKSPGSTSSAIYANAKTIGNKNSLKAGDLIVRPGHVVMCENDGCSTIIHAAGKNKGLVERSSSYYLDSSWGGKVVNVSDFCTSC